MQLYQTLISAKTFIKFPSRNRAINQGNLKKIKKKKKKVWLSYKNFLI